MYEIQNIASQIYAKFAFEPTFGQKKIIEKLSDWVETGDSEQIFVLNGYAGTGKTTLLGALVSVLRDNGQRFVLLAPTGRAAKVLAQYTGEKTYTIHKKIYRQQSGAAIESKFSLDYNRSRDTFFIVDEASMLSNGSSYDDAMFGSGSLLEDLIKYVRSGRNCHLMLVGDSAQLPPVGNDYSPALDPVYMSAFGDVSTARWTTLCDKTSTRVFCSTPLCCAVCSRTIFTRYRSLICRLRIFARYKAVNSLRLCKIATTAMVVTRP